YTGTPSGSISTNNGTITANVAPGPYTSVEADKPGWALTSISCDDSSSATPSTTNLAGRSATFQRAEGQRVGYTCINAKQGNVIIKKTMSGGTDSFTYTGTPNGTISTNNGTIMANVAPGQYTSVEGAKTGWDVTSISCDDSSSVTPSTTNLAGRSATFQ